MPITLINGCKIQTLKKRAKQTAAERDWYRAHFGSYKLVLSVEDRLIVREYTAVALEMLDILLREIKTDGVSVGAYGVVERLRDLRAMVRETRTLW